MNLAKIPAKRFKKYLLDSNHLKRRPVEFLVAFNGFSTRTYKDLYTTLTLAYYSIWRSKFQNCFKAFWFFAERNKAALLAHLFCFLYMLFERSKENNFKKI